MGLSLVILGLILGGASMIMWYYEAKVYLDYKALREDNKPNNKILLMLYEMQTIVCGLPKLIPLTIDIIVTYMLCRVFSSGSQFSMVIGLGASDVLGVIIVWLQYKKQIQAYFSSKQSQ